MKPPTRWPIFHSCVGQFASIGAGKYEARGWPVSRILSSAVACRWMAIHLRRLLPGALSLPTRTVWGSSIPVLRREVPIWHCSRWGLPCRLRCRLRGGLLPHRFTVTVHAQPSVLCGAFPGVAPAGRYPAPCFLKSGLSSRVKRKASPKQPSSHPRNRGLRPKWRSRQRGNGAPDRGSSQGRSHQEARDGADETVTERS